MDVSSNVAYKKLERAKRMILKEGGNIFKDADGKPVTQRIARDDVDPTLDWVEKITGIAHKDMKLGSTGIKSSSGDIDVAINQAEVDKEELYQKLVAWASKNHPNDPARAWVAKSGTNVHFKTPINGNPENGYVQTDLMFGDPNWMKFALKGSGDGSIYKGAHRMIMLASIAKAQGMQWSPTKGLVNRETKEVITTDPNEIAKRLIGQGANRANLDSVETINKAIKTRPDYEQLVADFKKNIEAQGLPMPEAKTMRQGIMIAEKNIFQKAIGKAVDIGRTAKAGFQAGYELSPQGTGTGPISKYKSAGGGKTTLGQLGDLTKRVFIGKDKQPVDGAKAKQQKLQIWVERGGKEKLIDFQKLPTYQKAGWIPLGSEEDKPEKRKPLVKQRESVMVEGARIQHIEDLVYFEGSRGAMRALASLRSMAEGGHKDVTIKWDGSPAVIFGRNEDGEFTLTDKSGFQAKGYDGRPTSAKDLQAMFINRKQSKGQEVSDKDKAFAGNMGSIFDTFERAVPKDVNGYFKGDLLYYNTPPVKDKNFVFKPNPGGVEYAVDVDSDLGKRIAKSKTAVVIHRMVAPDGSESPLKDIGMFQGTDLLVVPPMSVETPPEVPNAELDRLAEIIKKDSADLDSLLDKNKLRTMQMTNFADVLYNYVNQSVDRGTLDSLGRDFMSWLMNHPKISDRKKQKIAEYIKQNMKAFSSLWEVVRGIMKVKNSIISQLDSQGSSVKATTAGKPGGEGYVLAHPGGDIKLVNRAGFTAANRAAQR